MNLLYTHALFIACSFVFSVLFKFANIRPPLIDNIEKIDLTEIV